MIGRKVWVFRSERRVYERDARGHAHGGPIWREHWCEGVIDGETPRLWLVGFPKSTGDRPGLMGRFPKKGVPDGFALDEKQIDRLAWRHEHAHRIAAAIQHAPLDQLIEVARLIDYKVPPP